MVIIVKQNTKEERIRELIQWIESQNLRTHISTGDFSTVIGVIGDTSKLDEDLISGLDIVEGVKRVSEPFKSANRKFHPLDSVIEVGADKIKVGRSLLRGERGSDHLRGQKRQGRRSHHAPGRRVQAPHLPL